MNMGAESSAFCSAARANGYVPHDGDITKSCTPHPTKYEKQQMELASSHNPNFDRVDPWTRDLATTVGCTTCGSNTTAPRGYLADTQGNGTIVLDSREGPMWVDDANDSRPVHLDPDESNDRDTQMLMDSMKTPQAGSLRDKAVREGKIEVEGSWNRASNPLFLQDMCRGPANAGRSGAALPNKSGRLA